MSSSPSDNKQDLNPSTVLSAKKITKTYSTGLWPRRRHLAVLKGATIQLQSGEIVGMVGENGSGKSTLMQIVVGSLDRDGGSIERSATLGYCPQDPVLYQRLTCNEHFELFGEAYGLERSTMERSRDEIYDVLFVRPTFWLGRFLWNRGDGWLIDGFGPDGVSARVLDVTNRVVRLQSGYLYHYAFAMLIGVAALVTWLMFAG